MFLMSHALSAGQAFTSAPGPSWTPGVLAATSLGIQSTPDSCLLTDHALRWLSPNPMALPPMALRQDLRELSFAHRHVFISPHPTSGSPLTGQGCLENA